MWIVVGAVQLFVVLELLARAVGPREPRRRHYDSTDSDKTMKKP